MRPSKSTGAVILVGGLGTRLRPLTLHRPKALMPVLNKPFLWYQFETLRKAGITHIVLAANPAFKKWKHELRKICPQKIKLDFVFEKKPLGTGGAIRFGTDRLLKIKKSLNEVVIFNGDILVELDLVKAIKNHRRNQADCTIVLKKVPDVSRFGYVKVDFKNRITGFLEKPKNKVGAGLINAGIYVMNPKLIKKIPAHKNISVEKELYPSWLTAGISIFGTPMAGYWNDIGTPGSYLKAHIDLMKKRSFWTGNRNLCKGRSLSLGLKVQLKQGVCMGSQVAIGNECVIKESVLLDKVKLEKGVQLEGVILGSGCRIGSFSRLTSGTVLGDGTKVPPYSII